MNDDFRDDITREDILGAITALDSGKSTLFGPSTTYDLLEGGRRYPPKAVVGLAARRTLGRSLPPDEFEGGEDTWAFALLRKLGFTIVLKKPKLEDVELPSVPPPRVWIENTRVSAHAHGGGGWEFGTCLWSPSTGKDGSDSYASMREPKIDDLVIHNNDNEYVGWSFVAASFHERTDSPPSPGPWAGQSPYYRIDLKDYRSFPRPIPTSQFIHVNNDAIREELSKKLDNYPFAPYGNGDDIRRRQQYLTRCTPKLYGHMRELAFGRTSPASPLPLPATTGQDEGKRTGGGPRFVQYFAPVLDALRDLGGEAKPRDVYAWISRNVPVPDAETKEVTKGGQLKFESKVGWARFYLAKAGLIDDRRRGIWTLTPMGRDAKPDHAEALALFKEIHSRFPRDNAEEEEAPPPASVAAELFDDPSRQFWFAGADWSEGGDQTERFLREGIWQNGHDEKFMDDVRKIKSGDRIAIKASFVQRHKLPFSAAGKPVSAMRIKAIGTVTVNPGDGKTIRVEWQPVRPPRDWYFYTYRTRLNGADPNDHLARQLILFAFGNAPQDYQFWLKQPHFAGKYSEDPENATLEPFFEDDEEEVGSEEEAPPSFTLDNILKDGCFLPRATLATVMQRLADKKNVILQGPPGTGKTWLAKRLGYALIGTRDRKTTRQRLRVVQFHPSLSYEDFVRGWRPDHGGRLSLIDGIFLETVQAAAAEPDRAYVLIVEEINRGNPAQVFGEMLTLLEDSKRRPEEAIELAYRRADGERIYIPPNLHVIGTMNIADRSLALVDLALRRRFAFITLEPALNEAWRAWCTGRCGFDAAFLSIVESRINTLNNEIAEDRSLGSQYRIGHSYVTRAEGALVSDQKAWFRNVVDTEIKPLLQEYWFDAPEKAEQAAARLVADIP